MQWFVPIDVLGGAIGIEPSLGQGHPIGGTGKWLPPFSYIMLMLWNYLFENDTLLHCDEC
jgi:hypothetical protein